MTLSTDLDSVLWISQSEAARLRAVSRQAIAALVKKGRFRTLKIGGKVLVRREDVEAFEPKPPGPEPKAGNSRKKIAGKKAPKRAKKKVAVRS